MQQEAGAAWARIVAQIQAGEAEGQEALYRSFERGLRLYFSHHLHHQDVEDRVHDTLVVVVSNIRNKQLQDPARLPGYLYGIARHQVAAYIAEAVRNRAESADLQAAAGVRHRGANPEQTSIARQQRELARRLLASLSEMDQQVLVRFYYQGQKPEQICRDLGLSDTQFRLRKSRAKKRFEEIARKTLRRGRLFSAFLMRNKVFT